MIIENNELNLLYNKLIDKGADRLILDYTFSLDIKGNYLQALSINKSLASNFLKQKYKLILSAINQNSFTHILGYKCYGI